MAVPNSNVQICNLGLDMIGQAPIASIDTPTTDNEATCARWYDQTRQELLRSFVWNFAKARISATRTRTPAFDFDDAYQLPPDFVRLISVHGTTITDHATWVDQEGDEILINNGGVSTLKIRYVKSVTDVNKFDALFRKVLALKFAMNVAYKFTLKKGVVERVKALYDDEIVKAVSIDGQEIPPKRIERSKSRRARTGHSNTLGVAGPYLVWNNP